LFAADTASHISLARTLSDMTLPAMCVCVRKSL